LLYAHGAAEPCVLGKLLSLLHPRTGYAATLRSPTRVPMMPTACTVRRSATHRWLPRRAHRDVRRKAPRAICKGDTASVLLTLRYARRAAPPRRHFEWSSSWTL
jgi:hypothetical protein